MRARVAIFASVVLCGSAAAEPAQYAVEGLPVGAKLNVDSASYREFKCSPSEQFDALTWCQKTRTDAGRRGSYTAGYSILHSADGTVFYVNRSQEAPFSNPAEVQADINRYSRSIGASPRIMKLPYRIGLPGAMIATWGGITLTPLDPQSTRILAEGKSPKKGLLIDFLGDLARSAKEGLPIYRIDGGPGFVWAASFGLRGRGTLRVVAADTSGLIPAPEQQATAQSTAVRTGAEANPAGSGPTAEQLQTEITTALTRIAELEQAAAAAEAARGEAAQARADAERAIEQTAATEKAQLEATLARLQADRAAADAKARWWQSAVPGAIGGLLGVLITAAVGFFMSRRKTSASKQPLVQPAAEPIELPAQSQNGAQEAVPHVASPEIAAAEEIVSAEPVVGVALGEQIEPTPPSPPSTVSAPVGEKLDTGGEVLADAGGEVLAQRPS